jgi:hypothetical protein
MIRNKLEKSGCNQHDILLSVKFCIAEYVLKEIHEGVCGSHSGGRMLAHKAVRAGYYWPTMNQESMEMVRRCDKCQRFAKLQTNPPAELSSVSSPWPFAQ